MNLFLFVTSFVETASMSVSLLRCELTTVMIFTRTGLSALMQSH